MKTYHLIVKSYSNIAAFKTAQSKKLFLQLLNKTANKYGYILHAFVVMDTHAHLLISAKGNKISPFIRTLLSRYTRLYNKLYSRSGLLFHHGSILYWKQYDSWKIDSILYILNNPIEARICSHHKDYYFSSYKLHTKQKTTLSELIQIDNSLIEHNFNDIRAFKAALQEKLKYQKSIAHIKYRPDRKIINEQTL